MLLRFPAVCKAMAAHHYYCDTPHARSQPADVVIPAKDLELAGKP